MDETLKQTLFACQLVREKLDTFQQTAYKWHLGQASNEEFLAVLTNTREGYLLIPIAEAVDLYHNKGKTIALPVVGNNL